MADRTDRNFLIIEGARQNNLKNLSLRIPHNALTVVTGVSGSGKSSLAFETVFAEGQWRFIESLSPYTRMFLERLSRPDVDRLVNVRPAIALEQKNPVRTARSTVGTASEIADYLRLLFAKIGRVFCPTCREEAKSYDPTSVANELLACHSGASALVGFPVSPPEPDQRAAFVRSWQQRGYVRLLVGDKIRRLETLDEVSRTETGEVWSILVDRLILQPDRRARLVEALETAFREGQGVAQVSIDHGPVREFSSILRCPICRRTFPPLRPVLFSHNHPLGACPECKGFGNVLRYDEQLVIPDVTRSLRDGAVEPWTKPSYRWWQEQMLRGMKRRQVDVTLPYRELPEQVRRWVWQGDDRMEGIAQFFEYLESKRYKMHVRVFLSRYRSPQVCPACQGSRLTPEALSVKVGGYTIHEVSTWPLSEVHEWLASLSLSPLEAAIACDVLQRLREKIGFLLRVGLDYLTLHRETRTLSGGEAQRIALATQLGARLVSTLYVLDEPTIGLHPRDTAMLAGLLQDLARYGNTVLVVEHDHQVIRSADFVVELGPGSGEKGGELICAAPAAEFPHDRRSLTARYLRGEAAIPIPARRRSGSGQVIVITGAAEHNLKNIRVRIPLGMFVCVTGVSGSGKSTLVEDILYAAAARAFGLSTRPPGRFESLTGLEAVRTVRLIDQEPIGRTPRSNPITYIKAYGAIRQIFADSADARRQGLTTSHFSFNTALGRCPRCQGNGYEKLEMYFFEDVYVPCEECEGRRFKPDVLNVRVRGASISDVLNMTVETALAVLGDLSPVLRDALEMLESLGLGYLKLGQPATRLSGGESQRLKIAAELVHRPIEGRVRRRMPGILYILDEPTTGLHTDDVHRLLDVLGRLVDRGHTVVVVEHHVDVMKCADWIIDLGPGGGEKGGEIVAEGRPEEVMAVPTSVTGQFLRQALELRTMS
ncbi:MAG: excinuclease ABC subunit A [Nitrospirae bacterium]|nr:MAG: excinuclease ABC subunit A [Nitrospirota bacterium]